MIQVRDEIECGETVDAAGNRWRKYRPGPVRIVPTERDNTGRIVVFTLTAFGAGTIWWQLVLDTIQAWL